jgi:hypothetical protein
LFLFHDPILFPDRILHRADEALGDVLVVVHRDTAGWVIIGSQAFDIGKLFADLSKSLLDALIEKIFQGVELLSLA